LYISYSEVKQIVKRVAAGSRNRNGKVDWRGATFRLGLVQ
jgi:hypothetical protein